MPGTTQLFMKWQQFFFFFFFFLLLLLLFYYYWYTQQTNNKSFIVIVVQVHVIQLSDCDTRGPSLASPDGAKIALVSFVKLTRWGKNCFPP
jgi:hypothetical protein